MDKATKAALCFGLPVLAFALTMAGCSYRNLLGTGHERLSEAVMPAVVYIYVTGTVEVSSGTAKVDKKVGYLGTGTFISADQRGISASQWWNSSRLHT